MKRSILILIMLTAVLFAITSCKRNKNAVKKDPNGKLTVITSNFPPYDFARQIAGDKINLSMLLPPGAESHSFEPSPRDIIAIQNSDIFIYTGGETDLWVDRILESMDTSKMNIIRMMDVVEVVEEEIVEGMEDDDEDDEEDSPHSPSFDENIIRMMDVVDVVEEEIVEGMEDDDEDDEEDSPHSPLPTPHSPSFDEHVWTSPRNAILIVRAITDVLCEVDDTNAIFYQQKAAVYIDKLAQIDADFLEVVIFAKRNTIVFADRFPFRYFADTYKLTYFAAFPGCSTETEPSAATVAFLINKIKAEKIPVVFHIELSNEKMADTISAETGAKKLILHACHNITKRDFEAGLGYLDFMRVNVENLKQALN